jgi:hypothetical protein
MTALPERILKWATDPYGGEWFPDLRDEVLAHNPDCQTLLRGVWLPRNGGVSCGLDWCHMCGLTYYCDKSFGRYVNDKWFTSCECHSRCSDDEVLAREEQLQQEFDNKMKNG